MKITPVLKLALLTASLFALGPGRAEAPQNQAQIDHTVAVYEKAWQEADEAKRAEYLAEIWARDGVYRDPTVVIKGAGALSEHIARFLRDFPNTAADRTSKTDFYGTSFRFSWKMVFAKDGTVLEGMDIGELDAEGRIVSITGFFGPLIKTAAAHNQAVVASYLDLLFKKFDLVALDKIIAPDAVYTQAVGLPYGGRYVGLGEWTKMFTKAQTYFNIQVVVEPVFLRNAEGNRVIANFSAKFQSKKTNKEITMAIAEWFELKDGKIVSLMPYYFDTKTFVDFLNEDAPKG